MKQTDWKIIYNNYQGLEKKAVDFLSKEAGKYLIRENDLYRLYVLPCEKEGVKRRKQERGRERKGKKICRGRRYKAQRFFGEGY